MDAGQVHRTEHGVRRSAAEHQNGHPLGELERHQCSILPRQKRLSSNARGLQRVLERGRHTPSDPPEGGVEHSSVFALDESQLSYLVAEGEAEIVTHLALHQCRSSELVVRCDRGKDRGYRDGIDVLADGVQKLRNPIFIEWCGGSSVKLGATADHDLARRHGVAEGARPSRERWHCVGERAADADHRDAIQGAVVEGAGELPAREHRMRHMRGFDARGGYDLPDHRSEGVLERLDAVKRDSPEESIASVNHYRFRCVSSGHDGHS
ncbi:MAG TPA: hypothetical protein VGH93_04805 [Solirubrobacteraceae bacterium]